nr:RNA 2'-phosphotransferase [Archaeoglobus neptunius]
MGVCRNCGEFEGKCGCGRGKVILSAKDRIRVSKFLSGILRHFGRDFGISIDEEGWATVDNVLEVLKERFNIGRKQLELIVKFDRKSRFEIKNGKIRARYGHSIPIKTDWSESDEIPDLLYHATSPANIDSIMAKGLLPLKRREVHMCATPEEAFEVGRRHSKNPVLIEINAGEMRKAGIKVRKKGKIYTADFVPPEFLKIAGK